MFYIATHPDVEEKLCEEIQTVLGEKNVGGESMENLRHAWIQKGGDRGSRPRLKHRKIQGSHCNTGLDLLKMTKLQRKHSILGYHRHAI